LTFNALWYIICQANFFSEDEAVAANERLSAPLQTLAAIYTGSLYGQSAALNQQWGCIFRDCSTFDDYTYVVATLAGINSKNRYRCLDQAMKMCGDDLGRMRLVFKHIPRKWQEKRQSMLQKAVALAKDKDELVATLKDFEIL